MSKKKSGHFTALEHRLLANVLFRLPEDKKDGSQADREASFDVMQELGLVDEMFALTIRGALPPLLPGSPKFTEAEFKADPQGCSAKMEAFEERLSVLTTEMSKKVCPFELDESSLKHILKMLDRQGDFQSGNAVLAAQIGRRVRSVLDGSYVSPLFARAAEPEHAVASEYVTGRGR